MLISGNTYQQHYVGEPDSQVRPTYKRRRNSSDNIRRGMTSDGMLPGLSMAAAEWHPDPPAKPFYFTQSTQKIASREAMMKFYNLSMLSLHATLTRTILDFIAIYCSTEKGVINDAAVATYTITVAFISGVLLYKLGCIRFPVRRKYRQVRFDRRFAFQIRLRVSYRFRWVLPTIHHPLAVTDE